MFPRQYKNPVYPETEEAIVTTKEGKLMGCRPEDIYIFRGVPYAQAKRFELAKPVPAWDGVRRAMRWGYVSPELTTAIAADEELCPHVYWRAGEDCQNLNLWTPTLDPDAKLPVVVWFHGGGWVSGSGIEQVVYDGENLSRKGQLVFVTFNSRQNCLGALDLSSVHSKYQDSVYCGLSDVLEAMRWVKRNIRFFGGDPDNVTVAGQAGGGKRAMSLLRTPEADGLYQKMAIGSCAGECMKVPEGWTRRQIAQRMGELTVRQLGLPLRAVEEIETLPYGILSSAVLRAEQILKKEVPERFRWEPVADGVRIFEDPFVDEFRPQTAGIPMMMGSSFGEMKGNARDPEKGDRKNQWSQEETLLYAREKYGEDAEYLLGEFRKAYPGHKEADLLYIDTAIRGKLNQLALRRAGAGEQVWNWVFDVESPLRGGTVAWHCGENPYVLHNTEYSAAACIPGISEKVEEQMSSAWISFFRTGNPNCEEIPYWPQVTPEHLPTMVFGPKTEVRTDHDQKLQQYFHGGCIE
ncbi:MAG: carboxylesterase family protein [Lachnospiraceae bacterium]|nr:carboxylesterase family protein [Lachnospiraceae bacterium]